MEDVIQFLIIIGAIFIGFVSQNKKKKRQQPEEEAFPPIFSEEEEEYFEEEEEKKAPEAFIPQPVQVTAPQPALKQTAKKKKKQATAQPAAQTSAAAPADLRSPQKAREAFIYSEIFNRKY